METDTSAFGASLSACGCQKMLHTSLCLSSWLRCGGRKRPLGHSKESLCRRLFLSATTEMSLLIYGVWAGRVVSWQRGRLLEEEEGRRKKVKSGKELRRSKWDGCSCMSIQQSEHIQTDICTRPSHVFMIPRVPEIPPECQSLTKPNG